MSALSIVAMLASGVLSAPGPYWPQILSALIFAACVFGYAKFAADVPAMTQILAAAGAGTVIYYLAFGRAGSYDLQVLWKYAIALPFTAAVLYFACRSGRRLLPVLSLGAVALLSLVFEFRSFSGICIAAIIAWLFHSRAGTSRWWVARAAVLGGLLTVAFNVIVSVIESGAFGYALQTKTENQLEGGGPAILSGRVEPPLSVAAISENPLLGWGNPQAIGERTLGVAAEFARAIGMNDIGSYRGIWVRADGSISLHSILFESWVSGGLLAALLPIALIALFVAAVFRAHGRFYPLIALISIQGIWDVVFSPWAGNRAALLGISALIAVFSLRASVTNADGARRHQGVSVAKSTSK
ncbi:hypothetical protein DZG00_01540 [Clavibacter lycopersici]|uniref:O-antigen ligase domain-containing protein n=2 Tax=Clavibacter lycopersici TaxID=2301718 RepID=A0A399TCT4_9MICO|nr:hypothetical protein [Clavibacter lycopersici]RIJ53278.1 hypothetical protein DZG00_01540 [Clavibacter lycopersici]RIJ62392.1 hypothetical protein DZG02_02065 [Clavibacter lycopersici]